MRAGMLFTAYFLMHLIEYASSFVAEESMRSRSYRARKEATIPKLSPRSTCVQKDVMSLTLSNVLRFKPAGSAENPTKSEPLPYSYQRSEFALRALPGAIFVMVAI